MRNLECSLLWHLQLKQENNCSARDVNLEGKYQLKFRQLQVELVLLTKLLF